LKAWPTAMTVAMVQGKMPGGDGEGQRGSVEGITGARTRLPQAGTGDQ